MAKKLSQMTTEDMRREMSIAGSPDKITGLMTDIINLIASTVDLQNPPELTNTDFALRRVRAELKQWIRNLEKRNNQQYI